MKFLIFLISASSCWTMNNFGDTPKKSSSLFNRCRPPSISKPSSQLENPDIGKGNETPGLPPKLAEKIKNLKPPKTLLSLNTPF